MKNQSLAPLPQDNIGLDKSVYNLQDHAFSLVCYRYELNNQDEIEQAYTKEQQFKNQSKQHQAAFQCAEAEWALLGQMQPIKLNTVQKSHLIVEQKVASLIDNPKQIMSIAAVICLAVMLPSIGSFVSFFHPPPPHIITQQHSTIDKNITHYNTGYGYQSEHTLSDGSIVKLNWNTDITVKMSKNQRLISLIQGEANFKVAKDPLRPFIVSVENVQAQAIGTEFTVQKMADNYANIAVSEGTVNVSTLSVDQAQAPQTKILTANQIITAKNNNLGVINNRSLEEINAWRDGIIIFDKRPLHEALQEISRYTSYDIKIKHNANLDQEVTATFFVYSADDALQSLIQLFNLHTVKRGNRLEIG